MFRGAPRWLKRESVSPTFSRLTAPFLLIGMTKLSLPKVRHSGKNPKSPIFDRTGRRTFRTLASSPVVPERRSLQKIDPAARRVRQSRNQLTAILLVAHFPQRLNPPLRLPASQRYLAIMQVESQIQDSGRCLLFN